MLHWLRSMIVPFAILLVAILCAKASAQSDPAQDALNETKLSRERGANNPVHYAQPTKIARVTRTVYVCSKTNLIERDDLVERIKNTKGFNDLDLVMVENPHKADVLLIARYVPFTFDYTLKAIDAKTSVDIASARVTAFNGYLAAIELSKELVARMDQQRNAPVKRPEN